MTLAAQIDELASRVLAGEVVFFIGAGFSVDSEENSTSRLQSRLLSRFDALTSELAKRELRERFVSTFSLRKLVTDAARSGALAAQEVVNKLWQDYYSVNDWMCAAFATLFAELEARAEDDRNSVLARVSAVENGLLRNLNDAVPIEPIAFAKLARIRDVPARGKAIFLETLGFGSDDIMAGDPFHAEIASVHSSYRSRQRPRHEILARLAREGLCPALVTTNYDLLIEGAYRLSGFETKQDDSDFDEARPIRGRELTVPTSTPHFVLIADPLQFFELGDGTRSALILKLHGCAHRYRLAKRATFDPPPGRAQEPAPGARGEREHANEPSAWERYLRAIVYTYREIQNWREDSWSRDLLSTLLRTRTMVLCGYSAADNVVHDTFRTVYEELARYRRGESQARGTPPPAEDAPAFFVGPAQNWEFHGIEILRAASQASGQYFPPMVAHPNYLQFEFATTRKFPWMDELFVWLYHRVLRRRQAQILNDDLRRAATALLGRSPRDRELRAIRERFDELVGEEERVLGQLGDDRRARFAFLRLSAWTDQFHPALLRQMALAEALARNQRQRARIDELRRIPTWYFPVSERPDWAAWAVVVELGLRQMIATHLGEPDRWCKLPPDVSVQSAAGAPLVTWLSRGRPGARGSALIPGANALAIHWDADATPRRRFFPGSPRSRRSWLVGHELPWPSAAEEPRADGRLPAAPDAREIWRWALPSAAAPHARNHTGPDAARRWLEEPFSHDSHDRTAPPRSGARSAAQ